MPKRKHPVETSEGTRAKHKTHAEPIDYQRLAQEIVKLQKPNSDASSSTVVPLENAASATYANTVNELPAPTTASSSMQDNPILSVVSQLLENTAEDCLALYQAGHTCSGVYTLHPAGGANTDVVCDMETMGGGWTVIQNRFDGSENFNRNWADYKNGFGLAVGEYWIGNDAIHNLTQANNSLYISITLTNGTTLYELYELFRISNEQDNYRLSIGGTASGTLGNRMTPNSATDNLNGREFSTSEGSNSCAQNHKGGWWYNGCYDAYLNGLFGSSDWVQPWYPLLTTGKSIQKTAMMIRRG
nr:angiopoietin-related protein 7 [Crassostrea gigas]